uniref:Uncharacterized protein n=1 Tax=Oryza sativa subsp. indica TaxID=39946 RepID=A0A679BBF2_ORYSI|nr:hypothetical protein [Oryza sativa Indica Group]
MGPMERSNFSTLGSLSLPAAHPPAPPPPLLPGAINELDEYQSLYLNTYRVNSMVSEQAQRGERKA